MKKVKQIELEPNKYYMIYTPMSLTVYGPYRSIMFISKFKKIMYNKKEQDKVHIHSLIQIQGEDRRFKIYYTNSEGYHYDSWAICQYYELTDEEFLKNVVAMQI